MNQTNLNARGAELSSALDTTFAWEVRSVGVRESLALFRPVCIRSNISRTGKRVAPCDLPHAHKGSGKLDQAPFKAAAACASRSAVIFVSPWRPGEGRGLLFLGTRGEAGIRRLPRIAMAGALLDTGSERADCLRTPGKRQGSFRGSRLFLGSSGRSEKSVVRQAECVESVSALRLRGLDAGGSWRKIRRGQPGHPGRNPQVVVRAALGMKQDDVDWVALAIAAGLSNDEAAEIASHARKRAWTVDEAERVVRLLWFRRGNNGFESASPLWTLLYWAVYVILKPARPAILSWFEEDRGWEKHDLIGAYFDEKVVKNRPSCAALKKNEIHKGALRFFYKNFLIQVWRKEKKGVREDGGEEGETGQEPSSETGSHIAYPMESTEEFQRIAKSAESLLIDPDSWDGFAPGFVSPELRPSVARWLRIVHHFDVCRKERGREKDPHHMTSYDLALQFQMKSYAHWSRKLGVAHSQKLEKRVAALKNSLLGLWIAKVLGVPVEPQNFDEIARIQRILCEVALHLDPKLLT